MAKHIAEYEFRLIATGQGWWAYQITRRYDGVLIAGGEVRSFKGASKEARLRIAQLHQPRTLCHG